MKAILSILVIAGICQGKSIIGGDGVSLQKAVVGHNQTRTRASSQTLTCYDYMGGGGDSVRAIDYIPALRSYNFDNRIGSCCFTGTWIKRNIFCNLKTRLQTPILKTKQTRAQVPCGAP